MEVYLLMITRLSYNGEAGEFWEDHQMVVDEVVEICDGPESLQEAIEEHEKRDDVTRVYNKPFTLRTVKNK